MNTTTDTCNCHRDTTIFSTPMSSIPKLQQRFAAIRTSQNQPLDKDETFHLTGNMLGMSANTNVLKLNDNSLVGTAVALTSQGYMALDVKHDPTFKDQWHVDLAYGHDIGAPPQRASFTYAVTGSCAKLTQTAPGGASAAGVDVWCIMQAGGGSVLTTIVKCLPSLVGGPAAFAAALLVELGPAAFDLVTKIVKCFG